MSKRKRKETGLKKGKKNTKRKKRSGSNRAIDDCVNRVHTLLPYTNRYNVNVLSRLFLNEYENKKFQLEDTLIRLTDKLGKLKKNLVLLESCEASIFDVGIMMNNNNEIKKIERKIAKINEGEEMKMWLSKASQLCNKTTQGIAKLVFANQLTSKDSEGMNSGTNVETFVIDSDRCHCGRLFLFDGTTHINKCKFHKQMSRVLVAAEDGMSDILVFRCQTEVVTNNEEPTDMTSEIGNQQKNDPMVDDEDETKVVAATTGENENARINLLLEEKFDNKQKEDECSANSLEVYTEFMKQFHEDQPPIPEEVFHLIYNQLNENNMMYSSKCKQTPVANILKNNTKYKHLMSHNVKITSQFNGKEVPVFTEKLYRRLLKRVEILSRVSHQLGSKIMTTNITMHLLLLLEGENKLANFFFLHKTRKVVLLANTKLKEILKLASKYDSEDLKWSEEQQIRIF